MAENFEKVLEKLAEVMVSKDLGQPLFNEAIKYFDILDSNLSTYEEKHRACILAEDLLSRTRGIPEFEDYVKKGRR